MWGSTGAMSGPPLLNDEYGAMSRPPLLNDEYGGHVWAAVTKSSNRQDLLLLFLGELFDLGDELVGGLLDGVVAAPLVVLRDFLVLGHRPELVGGLPRRHSECPPGGQRPAQGDGQGQESLAGRRAARPRRHPEGHRQVHRQGRRARQEKGAGDPGDLMIW